MERINGGMISVKLVEKSFHKYKNRLSNLPQDFNPTFLKHFDKDSYRFVWHKRKKKAGDTKTPLKSIKRVVNSYDRIYMRGSNSTKKGYKNDYIFQSTGI